MLDTISVMENEKSLIALGSRGIQLTSFDELYRFSGFIIKAGLAPRSVDTPEKVFLALQYALEMGLTPMVGLQNCMVINNRVSFYGELVVGQMQAHAEFEDMTTEYLGESGPTLTCTVTIKRKGRTPSVGSFAIAEAQHLVNDPNKKDTWGKYPRRMLFWRAFSRAKVIFSDVLKGVTLTQEASDEEGFDGAKQAKAVEVKKPDFGDKAPAVTQTIAEKGERLGALAEIQTLLGKSNTPVAAFLQVLVNNKLIERDAASLEQVPDKALQMALDDWETVETQLADITEVK
jgi:hypothetical protein